MASKVTATSICATPFGGLVSQLVSLRLAPAFKIRQLILSTVGIGEICNFAAYAFAPAILVTPLGALSVLIGAVLGSYFLKEELGILGKLGSAICLIGAVVIVLHAPPDEEIETTDQILHYAVQPGMSSSVLRRKLSMVPNSATRFPSLCHCRRCIRRLHDLPSCATARQEKCAHLPLHLLDRWLHFCHVSQGFRHRPQAYLCRQ